MNFILCFKFWRFLTYENRRTFLSTGNTSNSLRFFGINVFETYFAYYSIRLRGKSNNSVENEIVC